MDPEEIHRKQKQTYLRTEILERNYDAEKFVDYMGRVKENGEDLENWDFEDLKQAVHAFQQANEPIAPEQDDADQGQSAEVQTQNKRKSSKSGAIMEDSDEEDIRYQPEIRTRDRGVTDPLHEEFIGRSTAGMDFKPIDTSAYESESEKKRKELLAIALEAKKATIVDEVKK